MPAVQPNPLVDPNHLVGFDDVAFFERRVVFELETAGLACNHLADVVLDIPQRSDLAVGIVRISDDALPLQVEYHPDLSCNGEYEYNFRESWVMI